MINAIQRGKQKRSMAEMKSISTALEAYATDRNFYPAAAGFTLPSGLSLPTATLGTAAADLSPTYIRITPLSDGWNSWYLYGAGATRADYAVGSAGADGVPQASPAFGPTTNFNADIILVDGAFVQFPDGARGDRRGAGPTNGGPAAPASPTKFRRYPGVFRADSCLNQPDSRPRRVRHAF